MTKLKRTYKVYLDEVIMEPGAIMQPCVEVEAEDFEITVDGNRMYVRFYKDETEDNDVSVAVFDMNKIRYITS